MMKISSYFPHLFFVFAELVVLFLHRVNGKKANSIRKNNRFTHQHEWKKKQTAFWKK